MHDDDEENEMPLETRALLAAHVDFPLRDVAAITGLRVSTLIKGMETEDSPIMCAVLEGIRLTNKNPLPRTQNLLRDHFEDGADVQALARKYGTTPRTVESHLRVHRMWWETREKRACAPPSSVRRAILQMYHGEGIPVSDLSDLFRIGPTAVQRHLRAGRDWWVRQGGALRKPSDLRGATDEAHKACTVAGCSKKVKATGLCSTHYFRMRRYGSVERPARQKTCGDCGRSLRGIPITRGMCRTCYQRYVTARKRDGTWRSRAERRRAS